MTNSCSCIYDDSDGDICYNWSERNPIAKKRHRCGECGETILPGEKYNYIVAFYSYGMETYKTCADCKSMSDAFYCDGTWMRGGVVWNDVVEYIFSMDGEIPSSQILKLTPKSRTAVFTCIDEAFVRAEKREATT